MKKNENPHWPFDTLEEYNEAVEIDQLHRVEDRDEWTDEQRRAIEASVQRFIPEATVLENPHFVRVGDRFGWVVFYNDNEDTSWSHQDNGRRATSARFHDDGPFLDYADRPPYAVSDRAFELHLRSVEGREQEERFRENMHELRESNPLAKDTHLEVMMLEFVHGEGHAVGLRDTRPVDVRIYCGARSSRRPCRNHMADVWHTPRGYWIQGRYRPMNESIPLHLDRALYFQEHRDEIGPIADDFRENAIALANWISSENPDRPELIGYDTPLVPPKEGSQRAPWLMLGCARHGNAAIDVESLRDMVKEARRARKDVSLDVTKRLLGRMATVASD